MKALIDQRNRAIERRVDRAILFFLFLAVLYFAQGVLEFNGIMVLR